MVSPTDTAGEAPAGPAPRSLLPLSVAVGFGISVGALQHADPLLATAAEYQIHPTVVVCVILSIAALFNWAVLKLIFLVARRSGAGGSTPLVRPTATAGAAPPPLTASASRSPVSLSMGLWLLMGAALHAEQLAAAAKEYQIDPAVVVGVVLTAAALFHLAVLRIHKSLASHQVEEKPKQLRRPRGRVPLLPFVVLALAIPTAASAEAVMAADATNLAQEASVWALLALAVAFNIAIGSLYCFIIAGPPPPAPTGAEPRPWSKAAGAIISFIAAAAVLVLYMLLASGGAAGAIAARS